mgnify:CR=1 FL=1
MLFCVQEMAAHYLHKAFPGVHPNPNDVQVNLGYKIG